MMQSEILRGNAVVDGRDFHHWFVGPLENWCRANVLELDCTQFALRDTVVLEVKWGVHPAGQDRPGGWAPPSDKISLGILVRGDFLFRFRDPDLPSTLVENRLSDEGDYVIWREDVEHSWRALDESVILTVRWKPE